MEKRRRWNDAAEYGPVTASLSSPSRAETKHKRSTSHPRTDLSAIRYQTCLPPKLVCASLLLRSQTKEAFALFDKKGTGTISRESLGDLLRALGQNPTQAEVAELAASAPRDIDFATFSAILNRPGGFSPAGTAEDFIRGFRVFDKEGNGYIGAGELRYVLTSLGEKLSDEEVDELMKGVQIGSDGNIDYEKFVRSILQQ
ncbi:hypothetical protein VP01_848g4 [Puccinia sorghi]|uniref:EF-hand domain-containing protein n=1 Tax=Puccinia sorghi TaxID=27349 RepID=A0A0L6U978_9BASI|nr:hypothetical protein VP01_848g4 [Puccinia sorghi]